MQADRERAQAVDRLRLGVDDAPEVVGRLPDRLLEQGEQQLGLAVEVLVEPAERLLRPVDDLLDRELGRALLVDERERGIEKALDAALGARAGRVQAARDRTLAPRGLGSSGPPGSTSLMRLQACL